MVFSKTFEGPIRLVVPNWYAQLKDKTRPLNSTARKKRKMAICMCCESHIVAKPIVNPWSLPKRTRLGSVAFGGSLTTSRRFTAAVRASAVDSHESSSDFAKRMDQAWIISQQPGPVGCLSCNSRGHVECKWCAGTGFFILGDNMLCQVPSRNTSCVICSGKGSACCSDCKGTGFRAKWLEKPPVPL